MKVAIGIDFIIRDWVPALIETYRKQIDDSWDMSLEQIDVTQIWEYFKFPVYICSQKMVSESKDFDGDEEVADVMGTVTVVDDSKDYEVNRAIFNQFVLDNILEIFGHAKETVSNAMFHVNKLQRENPKVEITLFSKAKGKLIPPTLFFLSKTGSEVKNILFIDDYKELVQFDIVYSGDRQLLTEFPNEEVHLAILVAVDNVFVGDVLKNHEIKFDNVKEIGFTSPRK